MKMETRFHKTLIEKREWEKLFKGFTKVFMESYIFWIAKRYLKKVWRKV